MKNIITSLSFLVIIFSISACKDKSITVSNPHEFREYISSHTASDHSVVNPISIGLIKPLEQHDLDDELPTSLLTITPNVKGKLYLKNGYQLEFKPEQSLNQDQDYLVTLNLYKLYEDIDKDLRTFTFRFKTIAQDFSINFKDLQSHNRKSQYLSGTIETLDYADSSGVVKILTVSQDGKPLDVKWKKVGTLNNKLFSFVIDNINRGLEDNSIEISWSGKSIGVDKSGKDLVPIPGYSYLNIISVRTRTEPTRTLIINFSDPIDPDQDLSGLVTIEKIENPRIEVNGNVVYVYVEENITGDHRVKIHPGIRSTMGTTFTNTFSQVLAFSQVKPQVQLISKGTILPSAESTPIYFKTINLSAVDVRVVKIYNDNILQFLQSQELNSTSDYEIQKVGRRIVKQTIHFDTDNSPNVWKARALNLSDFFKADPGAIYRIEFSFKRGYSLYDCETVESQPIEDQVAENEVEEREQQYWDNKIGWWRSQTYYWRDRDNPCKDNYYNEDVFTKTNVLGSDLGLIVKKGTRKSYNFITTNLLTGAPEAGVRIQLYNYQQQLIETLNTGSSGILKFNLHESVAFVVAYKDNNYAYAKLEDGNALSMSKFDVAGAELQKGLKGFIYTERGVYRPGDSIHLTFVLDDTENPLPKDVPVKLEMTNAEGKIVQRIIATSGKPNSSVKRLNHFYYFPIVTEDMDPTGNWSAKMSVGGAQFYKTIKVATVKPNRLRIKLDFNDDILNTHKPIAGKITGSWLHGAIARKMKVEMELTLSESTTPFADFPDYVFNDPVKRFSSQESTFLETELNEDGMASFSKKIKIDDQAPGMLKATFLTKLFEGGGDFSMDVFSKELAPYSYFVGLQSPETDRYGSYLTDKNTTFNVVSVDAEGKPAPHRNLQVQVFKMTWRWWWNTDTERLSTYENAMKHSAVQDFTIKTNTSGKGSFQVNIPDRDYGRYLIRVVDNESGHATGRTAYFVRNWSRISSDESSESSSMLVFSGDKEKYSVNETAHITFPSGDAGHALISIENGTKVLSTQWVETKKGETKVNIPITPDMAPNIYVNISLLQAHDRVGNDFPVRLYGVIPLKVEDPNTILKPEILMPDVLKPEEEFTVKVKEKDKKAMTYTLAVVDEGLLDLTHFNTPDIHSSFYTRQALGVRTFDIYDYVIGAYTGSVNNIYEIGGDDFVESGKKQKAERFKPVVKFLGPFHLKAGETKAHKIKMPNYVGSVRTMVVAGDAENAAYGNTEKTSAVKKPLMVLATLPRKLSPGETVTIPVTVFAMENNIKNVAVNVTTSSGLQALEGNTQNITFDKPDEQIVNFKYAVKEVQDIQKFTVNVSGNGEKASYDVEFDIFNPNPYSHRMTDYKVERNGTATVTYSPYGVGGTDVAKISFSTLPPMNLSRRIQYLIRYPHGCVEQTTSAGFPQLFLMDITDLSFERKQEMEENIKKTIKLLGEAQLVNGAFPFWPGNNYANSWATSYAGHFLLEAQKKGYALPIGFTSNWLQYQKKVARQWSRNLTYDTTLDQAYRLYTIALAGDAEIAAMNRLRSTEGLSNEARWRLAAAYAILGQENVAKQILTTAQIDFKQKPYDYRNYGSIIRNEAMALETMVIMKNDRQRDLASSIAKKLSSDRWYSTQSTSYALLALSKMVETSGGAHLDLTISQNGKTMTIKTDKSIAERELPTSTEMSSLKINNNADNIVHVTLYQEGKLPFGREEVSSRNLAIHTTFYSRDTQQINVSQLRQGSEIEARISVTNTSNNFINDLTLSQIFPSGWEIINTSFTELEGGASGEANYIDIRDDRVYFHFDLKINQNKTFKVKLNTSYLGKYYLPGTNVQAMYDNDYYAQGKGQWIEVFK